MERHRPSGEGLVYHSGGLGDFVLSLPAIERARQAYPASEWRYWGPSERLCLLPGFRGAPAVILEGGHGLWGPEPPPAVVEWLRTAFPVLAFGGAVPPAWAEHLGEAVVGLSAFPGSGAAWVPLHQARQLARRGLPPPRSPWLERWRREVLPDRTPSRVVVHPGSGSVRKNLPVGTWHRVAEILRAETGLPVEFLLGPAEVERCGGPAAVEGGRSETLGDLLRVLARTALFLGNDSGPAQLAGALGLPTVSVFGPSDPRVWRPLGRKVRAVACREPCAPCSAGGPIECPSTRCLATIPAEEIARAGLELLGPPPRAGGSRGG